MVYLKQFEAAAFVKEWSDQNKATVLMVAARSDILQEVSVQEVNNVDIFIDHLKTCSEDKHPQLILEEQQCNRTVEQFKHSLMASGALRRSKPFI